MLIYGYVRLVLDSVRGTKKTCVQLFPAKKRRDDTMYQDYAAIFKKYVGEGETDCYNERMMTEEEFKKTLEESDDVNTSIFGVFSAIGTTVQFEPFSRVV